MSSSSSNAGIVSQSSPNVVPDPGPTPESSPPLESPPVIPNASVSSFQPALAVRDVSCLACHANIQGNLITDFGYGSPWFMNKLDTSKLSFGDYHYTALEWQVLKQIQGQVFVPKVGLPVKYVQSLLQKSAPALSGTNIDLADFLMLPNIIDYGGSWYSYFGDPKPSTTSFTSNVTGNPAVVSESQIFIGAPSAMQVLGILKSSSVSPSFQSMDGAYIPGLKIQIGSNGTGFVTNSGNVACSGKDIVINGTLLLKDLQIFAENSGCRFYVTGSVFIVGGITYLSSGSASDPTSNLQISSASSIVMGVGLDGESLNGDGSVDQPGISPLKLRLVSDVRSNLYLRAAPSDGAYSTLTSSILAEAANLGSLLVDASVVGSTVTGMSAAKQKRTSVQFEHILLNAPLIHSRYMGSIKGLIIAESALFSLGEFQFVTDPVFQGAHAVPILPALKPYDVLCVGDPCNPIATN